MTRRLVGHSLRVGAFAAILFSALSSAAGAEVITFNFGVGTNVQPGSGSFVEWWREAGFDVRPIAGSFFDGPDRAEIFTADSVGPVTFTRVGGGLFDLVQLEVVKRSFPLIDVFVRSRFTSSGGGDITADAGLLVFPTTGWRGISSFTWWFDPNAVNSAPFVYTGIDNVQVQAVPEPVTAMLLAVGGAAVAIRRHRRT